ncbi:MAG: hypothetical protein HYT42_00200 [Candidatus Sungbacteria bacterium]|nr:hypothetical protein [Candidatus Sungbacteria bacterium]
MLLELKTHDPSGSGYIGTLRLEDKRVHTDEPPYPEVQRLAIQVTGWSVWKEGKTETAYLSTDEVVRLRDALDLYLRKDRRESD